MTWWLIDFNILLKHMSSTPVWGRFRIIHFNKFHVLALVVRVVKSEKTRFCSSLLIFILWGVNNLLMLAMLIYVHLYSTRFPYQIMFMSFNSEVWPAYPSRSQFGLRLLITHLVLLSIFTGNSNITQRCF